MRRIIKSKIFLKYFFYLIYALLMLSMSLFVAPSKIKHSRSHITSIKHGQLNRRNILEIVGFLEQSGATLKESLKKFQRANK